METLTESCKGKTAFCLNASQKLLDVAVMDKILPGG